MISACPYCHKDLTLSEGQQQKIAAALTKLQAGGVLKLGCPHCRMVIQLQNDGTLASTETVASPPAPKGPQQPAYPDISWLATGMYNESKSIEDIPKVMIIMADGAGKDAVTSVFENIGYQVELAESSTDAIAKMRFVNFAAVVLHSTMEGSLQQSAFHAQMQMMPMDKRRYIYYILVGPEFHTLYDLEALSCSANLVINDCEISNFNIILRKGLRDYDELFGPYMNAMKETGA